jgi:CubicO group peptidase (beta-lactamase class C family)
MMRLGKSAAAWALVAGVLATAVRAAEPDPAKVAQIPAQMQGFVEKGEISGIVTLVATKDKVVHLAAVGKSDLESGRAMRTDDLFWIASMSKPITAVAVAICKDDGKLSFDDPVEKYIPEFKKVTVAGGAAAARPITLRDLLTHTSGMGEYAKSQPHWTLQEFVDQAVSQPLKFQPGTKWSYSTAGIDALGRVVEIVSGKSLDTFMKERIFDPLQMTETTFWLSPGQEKRFAHNYRLNNSTHKLEPAVITYMYGTEVTDRQRAPLGGAGLFSTASDVGKFYQMTLNRGSLNGKRILKPETLAAMLTVQTGELTARPGMPWGYGFCIVTDPKAMEANAMLTPGSYGHGGAHGTSSWVDPAKGAVYVIMLQRASLRNPDNSDMHRVFQETADAAFGK